MGLPIPIEPRKLLDAVLVTGAGTGMHANPGPKTVQAYVVGTGAVSATVKIQVANIDGQWLDFATITLSGTTSATDGTSWVVPWAYIRANCTALSGTGAALTVAIGDFVVAQ